MSNNKKLLKEVLSEITPTDKNIITESDEIIKKINTQLKKDKIKASAIKGGSIAKNTNLKGDADCDVFVRFDMKYGTDKISGILHKSIAKVIKNITILHGSRDYYSFSSNLNYEIVPVLHIKKAEQAKNVTDCSPLHTEWVNKFPKIKGDIRLAKAFAKS